MAAESGIDLRSVSGSGPGGRIIKRDVEGLISQGKPQPLQPAQAPQRHLRAVGSSPFQKSATAQASAYRDEPASEMRRTIAKRLVTSLGPVPHFFLTTEIEMDRAAEMRSGINELDPELKISVNDIIIKVAAAALMQHPQVNASFQDKVVRYYEHADIGVAVAIEEGLITPIVRSADQKSLSEIAAEVRDLAERARNRKLKPEEYTGRQLFDQQPRNVWHRRVHCGDQSTRRRDSGGRRDVAKAGGARQRDRRAPDDARHDVLRPSRDRRRHRSEVPADLQEDSREPTVPGCLNNSNQHLAVSS